MILTGILFAKRITHVQYCVKLDVEMMVLDK